MSDTSSPPSTTSQRAFENAVRQMTRLKEDNDRLRQWVADLQAGCYINCVYCGHRYGPDDEVPAAMADVLKEHIEKCPEHPMSKLKAVDAERRAHLRALASLLQEWGEGKTAPARSALLGLAELTRKHAKGDDV